MDATESRKSKSKASSSATDLLEPGHALGQIVAAARGLEIVIEQQTAREKDLREENHSLRESGRRIAVELTELMMNFSAAKEAASVAALQLSDALRERALLRDDFSQREHARRVEEEAKSKLHAAEALARENRTREEINQVAKFAAAEARMERDSWSAKIAEMERAYEALRARSVGENARLLQEVKVRAETVAAVVLEADKTRAAFAEYQWAGERRVFELESKLSEIGELYRAAEIQIVDLTARLERERTAPRSAIEENDERDRPLQTESQAALRQARIEFEILLKQVHCEAQRNLDLAHAENRGRIEELERAAQELSDELEVERKRKHEADQARREAEIERDTCTRDSAARIRRLEEECAELAEELKRMLDHGERRIATLSRMERKELEVERERTRIAQDQPIDH